jgi:dephospho-CoA kinase
MPNGEQKKRQTNMIFGITGTDGAGKGAAVKYLVEKKGFTHYSSRALITEKILEKGYTVNRENMRLVANELRKEHGNDVIVQLSLQKARADNVSNFIIESIRVSAEVQALHQAGGLLLAIDANQNARFRRITGRKSESDNVTFAEFIAHEKLEMNDPDPNGMQKAQVMEAADYTIMNDGSLKELGEKIEEFYTAQQK